MVSGCEKPGDNADEWSSYISMFFIRAHSPLQPALDRLKTVDDKALHSACLGAMKKCNVALEKTPRTGVIVKKRSNGPAL